MCSKPTIFCSKVAQKGKICLRLLEPQKVAPKVAQMLPSTIGKGLTVTTTTVQFYSRKVSSRSELRLKVMQSSKLGIRKGYLLLTGVGPPGHPGGAYSLSTSRGFNHEKINQFCAR